MIPMGIIELILLAILAYICGFAAGYFVKTMLRIFLVFLGFYILLTIPLVYFHIITINVSFGSIIDAAYRIITGIKSCAAAGQIPIPSLKEFLYIIVFAIGFLTGLRK